MILAAIVTAGFRLLSGQDITAASDDMPFARESFRALGY